MTAKREIGRTRKQEGKSSILDWRSDGTTGGKKSFETGDEKV